MARRPNPALDPQTYDDYEDVDRGPPPESLKMMRYDGSPIEYVRKTEELCPVCNPASQGAKLYVRIETPTTDMLECKHCGYECGRPKGSV